jgi:hypothetical protein
MVDRDFLKNRKYKPLKKREHISQVLLIPKLLDKDELKALWRKELAKLEKTNDLYTAIRVTRIKRRLLWKFGGSVPQLERFLHGPET